MKVVRNVGNKCVHTKVKAKWGKVNPKTKRTFKDSKKPVSVYDDLLPDTKPLKAKKSESERPISLGESIIKDWLTKHGFKFVMEKKMKSLINPITGQKLIMDFYLHSERICIEFDGKQHFEKCDKFHKKPNDLEYQITRDRIKDRYCQDNGIRMIRISYKNINRIAQVLAFALLSPIKDQIKST